MSSLQVLMAKGVFTARQLVTDLPTADALSQVDSACRHFVEADAQRILADEFQCSAQSLPPRDWFVGRPIASARELINYFVREKASPASHAASPGVYATIRDYLLHAQVPLERCHKYLPLLAPASDCNVLQAGLGVTGLYPRARAV